MKATFVASVREGLHTVWVDECLYAGHSVGVVLPFCTNSTSTICGSNTSAVQRKQAIVRTVLGKVVPCSLLKFCRPGVLKEAGLSQGLLGDWHPRVWGRW